MRRKEDLIKKLKQKNLINEDEALRLVIEHDKKELEKAKQAFDEKFNKLKKNGKLDFLGLS